MSSLLSLLLLVFGIVLVVAGAELFFEGLLASAPRLGVSPFALTVLVSGFEIENIAAGIAANLSGLPNAAAGTFLGGTTFLALAVTGTAALFAPVRVEVPRGVAVWTAVAPLPLLAVAVDGTISRLDGAILLAWSAIALVGLARAGKGALEPPSLEGKRFPLGRLALGLGALTAGGELLGEGVRRVVDRFGITESLLGNTALAASVEAEEVARVVTPSRHGRSDIALANITGTIVHFVAFNAAVVSLVRPIPLDGASRALHLPAAVAATLLVAALVASPRTLGRRAGVALVLAYAGYVAAAIAAVVFA